MIGLRGKYGEGTGLVLMVRIEGGLSSHEIPITGYRHVLVCLNNVIVVKCIN